MSLAEQAALLHLLGTSGRPWSAVADLVEERGSALELLRELGDDQQSLFEQAVVERDGVRAAIDELERWRAEGIHFASLLDPEYPSQLSTIHQRPPFITWMGHLDVRDAEGVAIVGTRTASDRGRAQAYELARGLAESEVAVISGGATGIDTAALRGSLDAGGRAVAVIGTGLHHSYPRENTRLQAEIAARGAVISQFLPDAPPTQKSFPMRNAVMSGYAAATVVVEAPWRSGARMQARLALQHGRSVYLMRSLLDHDWARDYATRPGAFVVDDVHDVLERLHRTFAAYDELVGP